MEALQNHENEDIYKLVYEIIDSYFGGVSEYFIMFLLSWACCHIDVASCLVGWSYSCTVAKRVELLG